MARRHSRRLVPDERGPARSREPRHASTASSIVLDWRRSNMARARPAGRRGCARSSRLPAYPIVLVPTLRPPHAFAPVRHGRAWASIPPPRRSTRSAGRTITRTCTWSTPVPADLGCRQPGAHHRRAGVARRRIICSRRERRSRARRPCLTGLSPWSPARAAASACAIAEALASAGFDVAITDLGR